MLRAVFEPALMDSSIGDDAAHNSVRHLGFFTPHADVAPVMFDIDFPCSELSLAAEVFVKIDVGWKVAMDEL